MKALLIYALTWFLVSAAAGAVYLTGYLGEVTLTIFGFIFSTLFFAGFVAVLPFWVNEQHSWKYRAAYFRENTVISV